ncbi:helix-turn-helix domain-containing protein [Haloplanus sp. GCM10025708]|uniref:helix-turn-helix domain-containing protein n=1 Tax=Haloplanus sp. GCM10025708 TaxID=3252679 RepID=UPI0036195343
MRSPSTTTAPSWITVVESTTTVPASSIPQVRRARRLYIGGPLHTGGESRLSWQILINNLHIAGRVSEYTMAKADGRDDIQPINRMFRIVETLVEMDGARVCDLADELGMAQSTAHRYLTTLYRNECVVREDGEYHVGLRFLDIGGTPGRARMCTLPFSPRSSRWPRRRRNGRSFSSRNTGR